MLNRLLGNRFGWARSHLTTMSDQERWTDSEKEREWQKFNQVTRKKRSFRGYRERSQAAFQSIWPGDYYHRINIKVSVEKNAVVKKILVALLPLQIYVFKMGQ